MHSSRGIRPAPIAPVILRGALVLAILLTPCGGARAERSRIYALTHARVIVQPGKTIENATIVLRDGLIDAVGKDLAPPADAFVLDATGKTVTAGFIDSCTDIGQKKSEGAQGGGPTPGPPGGPSGPPGSQAQREAPPGPVHAIGRIHPERKAIDSLVTDGPTFEKHRALGFTSALTLPTDGIFRGEAALIALGSGTPSTNILKAAAGQVVGFERGSFGQGYPSSLMGTIAAIRQALLDAQRSAVWAARYQADPAGLPRPEYVSAFGPLAAAASGATLTIFDARSGADVRRSLALAQEFALRPAIIASGLEAADPRLVEALKRSGLSLILPLAYPDKPKVDDADEALAVSLRDLERWDAAPGNPAAMEQAGIPFALGTCRLPGTSDFPPNLRKALTRGLSADAALAALTVTPARLFGMERALGTIEPGKIADLAVFDAAPADGQGVFDEKAKPAYVFVDGLKLEIEQKKSKGDPSAKVDPRGTWSISVTIGSRTMNRVWTVAGTQGAYAGTAETQAGTVDFVSVKLAGNEMTVVLPPQGERPRQEIAVVITGDTLEGSGDLPGGASYTVKGRRTSGPDGGA